MNQNMSELQREGKSDPADFPVPSKGAFQIYPRGTVMLRDGNAALILL
jgi:hypothetical protein